MNAIVTPALIDCPVCKTSCSNPPLYRYTALEAATHFCPVTRNAERHERLKACINRLWQGNECVILRCPGCEFTFGYPFISGDEEFYGILHEQQGYPAWRWDYDVAMREAVNPLKRGRILDIGAGVGMFLRTLGQEWECYGIEGSELTRTQLEAAGIHVFRNLEAMRLEAGTFQVVTLFQVLEHIAEFRQTLTQCHQLLEPGGKIVITVPDGNAMIRQERVTGCPDMPPNHINKWAPKNLALALHEAGFETQAAIYEPSSWRNLKSSLYLRVLADATHPRSVAAQVYRLKNKRLRVPLLASLGGAALVRMLPHVKQLQQGGAFAMIGIARSLK
jgi:SAM-dependent methyltransferase